MATPGDINSLLALMTPTIGRGGVALPTPSVDPQFGGEGDAAHPGGQFGTRSLSPGGVPFGDLNAIVDLMGRSSVSNMAMPSLEERAAGIFNRSVAGDPFLTRASMIGQMGPGGRMLGTPQIGGRFSRFGGNNQDFAGIAANRLNQLQLESLLKAQFGPNASLRPLGNEFNVVQGSSGGGNPSNTATASGFGESITAGAPSSGVLGSTTPSNDPGDPAGHPTSGIVGDQNDAQGGMISGSSPIGPSATGFSTGLGTHADSQNVGTQGVIGHTSDGQAVTVSSSGVVSVGGQAVGVVGGGSGGGGVGGGGSVGGFGDAGGVGMDGSSNAGIGGPGGTGAVGSAGDAGQGTGGPGEGDMYGGHFTVGGDPRAGPDSMNVRFKASPGEKVVVIPQGMTPGQILARPEQMSTWRMTGNPPNPGPGPNPGPPVPPGTPAGSIGGIEALLAHMKATPGRR